MTIELQSLVFIAGIGHIVLAVASLSIPEFLNWREELSRLSALMRQLFWTYAAYLFCIHLFFGILSVWFASELVSGSNLALVLTTFITLYWTGRILIQFLYFDRSMTGEHWMYRLGEIGLIVLFCFFVIVYGWAALVNV